MFIISLLRDGRQLLEYLSKKGVSKNTFQQTHPSWNFKHWVGLQYLENSCRALVFQFRMEMLDTLYACAKFHYECGNYSRSSQYLYFVRIMVSLSKTFKLGLQIKFKHNVLVL